MKTKSFLFIKVIFLFVFILVFVSSESFANVSNSTYLNESKNLEYENITAASDPNMSLINCTVNKTDNYEILANQTLNNKLKMNGSSWAENILNLATFLTSIVSLLTLNELKKQRYLASTPKLHIIAPENYISVKNKKFNNIEKELPAEWGKAEWDSEGINIKTVSDSQFPPMYSIPLKLINTGSSPALNVKITWNYDPKTITKILNQFNELGLEEVGFSHSFENNHIKFSRNKEPVIFTSLLPCGVDYILPFSNLNSETEIFIPNILSIFVTLKLCVLSFTEYNHNEYSILILNAEIAYYDNINILHKEYFSIEFKPGFLHWDIETEQPDKKSRKFKMASFSIESHKINGMNREKILTTKLNKYIKKLRLKLRETDV